MMLDKLDSSMVLPDGFTAVKYIQSSGNQYIDTGRKLTQDSDISIIFDLIDIYNSSGNFGIFGSRESALKNNLTLFYSADGAGYLYIDFSEGIEHRHNEYFPNHRIKIRVNKSGVWVGNILKKSWSDVTDFETPTNGLIFGIGNDWAGKKAIMRLYIYTDGDAQRLVPCLDADGVPCLYDLIGRTALYNQGSGSFTWG